MKRDWRIEAFRCLMMFCVCLHHAAEQGGYAAGHRWLGNLMRICVPGFVLISGYFGLTFSWNHIRKILAICAYCLLVIGILNLSRDGSLSVAFLRNCYGEIQGAWFVWCYIALMMVAPVINPLFEKSNPLTATMPILCLCFGWSYLATIVPITKSYLPHVGGFGSLSLLTLVGVYVVGRLCCVYAFERKVSPQLYFIGIVGCSVMMMSGFHHYCSPFNVCLSVLVFCLFSVCPLIHKS